MVSTDCLVEALGSRLFLALNEEHNVASQDLCSSKIGCSVERCENGSLIIRDTTTIEESVDRSKLIRISSPLGSVRFCANNIVVAVEKNGLVHLVRRGGIESGKYDGVGILSSG